MKRESRYVQVARMAYQLAEETLPKYSHRNSPKTYSQPQLAACVLLMFYLNVSYRDMEEWLLASDQVCTVLELAQVPDHSTLSRMYRKLNKGQLDQMQRALLDTAEVKEDILAADSTSFTLSQASAYYRTHSGKTFSDWIKGGYIVGVVSQLIVGSASQPGRLPDFGLLKRLKRQARRYATYVKGRRSWTLLADRGFDAKELRPGDLVPPIRRFGKITAPERRERAEIVDAARLDGLFGLRWIVETVNSVIKRKMGDTIRSRSHDLQRREAIVKGLVYNIHRLVVPFLFLMPSNFATVQVRPKR
ncbi:MAG: transposase [Hyphomicrobiales bacterium]|nr:transposase [Hyphomicrobiales bacterium]